jgi:hypothetical protein
MDAKEKVGIESLLELMDAVLAVGADVTVALDDGKLSLTESLGLAKHVPGILRAVKAAPGIPGELMDLDDAERTEIVAHFADKFSLPNDEVEQRVERLFGVAVNLAREAVEVAAIVKEFRAK